MEWTHFLSGTEKLAMLAKLSLMSRSDIHWSARHAVQLGELPEDVSVSPVDSFDDCIEHGRVP